MEYYTEEYVLDNPRMFITVRRPILTPEEREKRMNEIARSAEQLLLAHWRNQEAKLHKEASPK